MKRKLFSTRYLLFFLVVTLGAASIFTGCSSEKENPTITYTVSFKTNNSTVLNAKKIEKGKTVTKPPAPNKSGYTFEGWYTTASFTGDPYNFGTAVTGSFTLYAKFTAAATSQATAPGVPTDIKVSGVPAKTQIIITWTAPANKGKKKDGTVATVKYEVQYKASSATAWSATSSSVAVAAFTTPNPLSPSTAYDFRVKSVNADDATKKSAWTMTATPISTAAAAAPPIDVAALRALIVACNGGDNTKCAEVSTANTSQITDMSSLFQSMASFNTDISNWDVSKVTNMSNMFYQAPNFNQPLKDWDVSKVTNMRQMFFQATSFNQPLNDWDTSKVISMANMFTSATSFNQPLNDWDTSKVVYMNYMFQSALNFNQPLNDWDTSKVTDINGMFFFATSFNQDLSGWTVSQVTDHPAFSTGSALTAANSPVWKAIPIILTALKDLVAACKKDNAKCEKLKFVNTSQITDMSSLFDGVINFNIDINDWDTSKVIDMAYMFNGATSFNQPLNNWDTSSVTNMNGVFYDAKNFNQPLNGWDTTKVTTMEGMFFNASSFNQSLNDWDVSKVTSYDDFEIGSALVADDLPVWN